MRKALWVLVCLALASCQTEEMGGPKLKPLSGDECLGVGDTKEYTYFRFNRSIMTNFRIHAIKTDIKTVDGSPFGVFCRSYDDSDKNGIISLTECQGTATEFPRYQDICFIQSLPAGTGRVRVQIWFEDEKEQETEKEEEIADKKFVHPRGYRYADNLFELVDDQNAVVQAMDFFMAGTYEFIVWTDSQQLFRKNVVIK